MNKKQPYSKHGNLVIGQQTLGGLVSNPRIFLVRELRPRKLKCFAKTGHKFSFFL